MTIVRRLAPLRSAAAVTLGLFTALGAGSASAGWWEESFEIHGFARTTARVNSPGFRFLDETQLNSLRAELNLETSLDLYQGDNLTIAHFMVLRPTYDAVYDLYPDVYGRRARSGDVGTGVGLNLDPSARPMGGTAPITVDFTRNARTGSSFPGAGAGVNGEFRFVNNDLATLFTGSVSPGVIADSQVFFGIAAAPAVPQGSRLGKIGGAPTLEGFQLAVDRFSGRQPPAVVLPPFLSGAQFIFDESGGIGTTELGIPGFGLQELRRSLMMAQQAGIPLNTPLRSPAQIRAGLPALGDRGSLKQLPFGVNDRQSELATDCFDTSNPYCFLREFYFEIEYKDTFVRLGKQQIVWGKADNFRLQDIVNPLDLGNRSIFVPLEDQRIPTWSLDVVQSLGDVGPFQDVSLELVWVFDKFLPIQLGQCGEPRAFAGACVGRAQAFANQFAGIGLAEVEEVDWKLKNTEPGFRFEFTLPEPQISFSVSGFLGFQDVPVVRLRNRYSVDNANPAAILGLQALSDVQGLPVNPVPEINPYDADQIDAAATVISTGYTAIARAACSGVLDNPTALADCIGGNHGDVRLSDLLANVGDQLNGDNIGTVLPALLPQLFDQFGAGFGAIARSDGVAPAVRDLANSPLFGQLADSGLLTPLLAGTGDILNLLGVNPVIAPAGLQINQLLLPFSGGQGVLEYPRVFTLGASMDYQVPGLDGVLRAELAYDFNRALQDSSELDLVSHSDVVSAVIGLDLNPFIPILSPQRTSVVSAQLFVQHVIDHVDRGPLGGTIDDEWNTVATFTMLNFFGNDRAILQNVFAYDFNAQAFAIAPQFKMILTEQFFVEFGANFVLARRQKRSAGALCADGVLTSECLLNPSLQRPGNAQAAARGFVSETQAPFFGTQSFGDELNEDRDEIFLSLTYQF